MKQALLAPSLLGLVALCGCASAPPAQATLPPVVAKRRLSDSLSGLWSLQGPKGRLVASLRLSWSAKNTLQAQFLPNVDVALPTDPVAAGIVGGALEVRTRNVTLDLRPQGNWDWPGKPQGQLIGELKLRGVTQRISAVRVSIGCPVCETETAPDASYCPTCGMHLSSPHGHDVQVAWHDTTQEAPFKAPALERLLSQQCRRTHKVVLRDLKLSRVDDASVGPIIGWAFLGVFSGFFSWEYNLSGTLRLDQQPPKPFRIELRLNFFERNGGLELVALSIVSFAYPAPLLSEDPQLVGLEAVKALAAHCQRELER